MQNALQISQRGYVLIPPTPLINDRFSGEKRRFRTPIKIIAVDTICVAYLAKKQ